MYVISKLFTYICLQPGIFLNVIITGASRGIGKELLKNMKKKQIKYMLLQEI